MVKFFVQPRVYVWIYLLRWFFEGTTCRELDTCLYKSCTFAERQSVIFNPMMNKLFIFLTWASFTFAAHYYSKIFLSGTSYFALNVLLLTSVQMLVLSLFLIRKSEVHVFGSDRSSRGHNVCLSVRLCGTNLSRAVNLHLSRSGGNQRAIEH